MKVHGEDRGATYVITLDLPGQGNALSDEMIVRLGDLLEEAAKSNARVILLHGAGDDFCIGRAPRPANAPNKPMEALELRRAHDIVFRVYGLIRRSPAPVVAVVRGRALGFGFALAAVSDVTIAADTATFQIPEFAHDIMPTMVMSSLVDRLPLKAILYRVYSAEPFSAAEAFTIGAVSAVVPADELDGATDVFIQRLLGAPPPAVFAVKEFALTAQPVDLDKAVHFARALHAMVNTSSEMRKKR
jgi:enoyl-CoA hydratase